MQLGSIEKGGSSMKHPLRSIAIWLGMIATGIGAFSLTVNITSDNLENSDVGSGVVIDLNQAPYEAATTQEEDSFWGKYRKSQEKVTEQEATTETSENRNTEEGREDE